MTEDFKKYLDKVRNEYVNIGLCREDTPISVWADLDLSGFTKRVRIEAPDFSIYNALYSNHPDLRVVKIHFVLATSTPMIEVSKKEIKLTYFYELHSFHEDNHNA
jgi:hypothetical protein